MNILIIQGPNLNLLGVKSSKTGNRLTLDKVNRALRRHVRNQDINLKILQTHKLEKVITLIQRNRNWADGIIIAPMSWARYEYALKETLELVGLPIVEVSFDDDFFMGTATGNSILADSNLKSVTGKPDQAFMDGVDILTKHLRNISE